MVSNCCNVLLRIQKACLAYVRLVRVTAFRSETLVRSGLFSFRKILTLGLDHMFFAVANLRVADCCIVFAHDVCLPSVFALLALLTQPNGGLNLCCFRRVSSSVSPHDIIAPLLARASL